MTAALLTDRDLADRYGKSVYFVQEQCRLKAWPHLRVGKAIRFTDEHVAAIDARLTVTPENAPAALPAPGSDNPWGRKGRKS